MTFLYFSKIISQCGSGVGSDCMRGGEHELVQRKTSMCIKAYGGGGGGGGFLLHCYHILHVAITIQLVMNSSSYGFTGRTDVGPIRR